MTQPWWNAFKACPILIATSLLLGNAAVASNLSSLKETPVANEASFAANSTLILQSSSEGVKSDVYDSATIEKIQDYNNKRHKEDPTGKITDVAQFRDLQPTDWAYEAFSRIIERYGCLQGYQDGNDRVNRTLSRYEFAAGLNACLRQIETLITNRPEAVRREDFKTLQRLLEEFRTELGRLGRQIDTLEERRAFLEER